jgi:predicted ATPase/class 3 adenylate cyclase/DNA-binding XRE family transcriptional regulator/Tfp pilus assembly protein PilF
MHEELSFGRWLKHSRHALDLTQEALAEQIGCSVQTIRKIESGKRRPSQQIADLLFKALRLPPQDRGSFMKIARAIPTAPTQAVQPQPAPTPPSAHTADRTGGRPTIRQPRAWPQGMVTFLFTDIEGSTRLWEQHPRAMPEAITRHDAIVRRAIESQGGVVFRTAGDSFCAAFADALDGVMAALAAQRALHSEPWGALGLPQAAQTDRAALRVRMALHTDTVVMHDSDYHGLPLSRVARLLAAGHGGQVLLSRATHDLVVAQLPPGVGLRDLGSYRLKDLSRPEQILQLMAADLPSTFPPLVTLDIRPGNLPIAPQPLIGRETELATITRQLGDPSCRLLTLTGPGGIGKTRLALQAAADNASRFSYGAYFVPLAPSASAQVLEAAIANVLGLTSSSTPTGIAALLINYLREKEMLLLLDNLEQLLGNNPPPDALDMPGLGMPRNTDQPASRAEGERLGFLAVILEQAPRVKLLVTSRERLRLQDEWVVELNGLAVPKRVQDREIESISAVALFLQRARQIQRDFTVSKADYLSIMQICRLVEGMPLGIELAAAWVRVLPCAEIAQELGRNLDFLAATMRGLPERHRSLRAVFDHSWNLLNQVERRALRRLSVFHCGFTRAAATAVLSSEFRVPSGRLNSAQNDTELRTQNPELLTLLAALMDKSLLRRMTTGRYDMHEQIRQYAASKLEEDPREYELTRDQHSEYYMALLRDRDHMLKNERQQAAIEELSAEIDNLRLAWQRAIARDRVALIRQALFPLGWFYELRTWFEEAELLFRSAAEQLQAQAGASADAKRTEVIGFLMAIDGWFCFRSGRPEQAQEQLHRSLAQLRACDDREALYYALMWLGFITHLMGDHLSARQLLEESLALGQALGNQWQSALALTMLGTVAITCGEYQAADRLLRDSLVTWRVVGDTRLTAFALNSLSAACLAQGAYAETQPLLHECITLSGEYGDRWVLAIALNRLGQVAHVQGDHEEARYLFRESLGICKEMGDRWTMAQALTNLAHVTQVLGDQAAARQLYREAFATASEAQVIPTALDALIGLAALLMHEGAAAPWLELLTQIIDHPAASRETRERAVRLRLELEATFAAHQAAAIQERMGQRPFDAVVAEVLDTHQLHVF